MIHHLKPKTKLTVVHKSRIDCCMFYIVLLHFISKINLFRKLMQWILFYYETLTAIILRYVEMWPNRDCFSINRTIEKWLNLFSAPLYVTDLYVTLKLRSFPIKRLIISKTLTGAVCVRRQGNTFTRTRVVSNDDVAFNYYLIFYKAMFQHNVNLIKIHKQK